MGDHVNRVRIYVSHCSRVDFLVYQYHSFRKYIKDPFEIIVINDALNDPNTVNFHKSGLRTKIVDICKLLVIKCMEFPEHLHKNRKILFPTTNDLANNANTRCSDVCQYALNDSISSGFNGLSIVMDGDMWFRRSISLLDEMKDYHLMYCPQSRGPTVPEYPWNAFFAYWPTKIPDPYNINFDCGRIGDQSVDCGGQTHYYLQEHGHKLNIKHLGCGELRIDDGKQFRNLSLHNNMKLDRLTNECLEETLKFPISIPDAPRPICSTLSDFIIHYHGGGNWESKTYNYHQSKMRTILEYFGEHLLPEGSLE